VAEPHDVHIRRSGDDYVQPYVDLLPRGQAWPTWDSGSALMAYLQGAAQIWGDVDVNAALLLEVESDPRSTVILLPDWERAFGLPDDCLAEPLTIGDRQKALVTRMTLLGGQSRQFFTNLAAEMGYQILTVEHSPFTCGISQVGDTRDWNGEGSPWYRWEIGPDWMRFFWTIGVYHVRLTWFRCTAGQCGVDPHLRIGLSTDNECLIQRYAPAHVQLAWDYSGLNPESPMAGTP
jgi:uncharacterized protein YmfQ (DUF2313 family)